MVSNWTFAHKGSAEGQGALHTPTPLFLMPRWFFTPVLGTTFSPSHHQELSPVALPTAPAASSPCSAVPQHREAQQPGHLSQLRGHCPKEPFPNPHPSNLSGSSSKQLDWGAAARELKEQHQFYGTGVQTSSYFYTNKYFTFLICIVLIICY